MINITKTFAITRQFIYKSIVSYHVQDLMRRPHTQNRSLLYGPAFHLYLDKIINQQQFYQKKIIRLILQQDKVKNNIQNYRAIFNHISKNIDKIETFKTLTMIFTVGYQNNWNDPDMWYKLGVKGFWLLGMEKKHYENKAYSYSASKFMIGLSKFTGLARYTDQDFSKIQIHLFKPLFVTYLLQLFWKQNIQSNYKFAKNLLEYLHSNQQMIPFSDVHHMLMAKKIIKDPIFYQITEKLQKRIRQKVNKQQQINKKKQIMNQETQRLDSHVVQKMFNQYVSDLQAKYL